MKGFIVAGVAGLAGIAGVVGLAAATGGPSDAPASSPALVSTAPGIATAATPFAAQVRRDDRDDDHRADRREGSDDHHAGDRGHEREHEHGDGHHGDDD